MRISGISASASPPAVGTRRSKQLTGQGFEENTLERAGLIVRREGGVYDMFRGRVIFPIISAQGKVLGFGGRALGDAQPKYLNTADTPVFNKRQGLYALNFAKKERSAGHLVLVGGLHGRRFFAQARR